MVSNKVLTISDDDVVAARQGDDEALSQLWDACSPIIDDALRFCRSGPAIGTDDLIQEAAIAFLGTLHGQGVTTDGTSKSSANTSFAMTLAKTVRWRLYNYVRRERRRRRRSIPVDNSALERALARFASGKGRGGMPGVQVQRALDRLSPRQRAVVDGIYFRDVEVAALAISLGVSKQAVTALHRRALLRLRQTLDGTEQPIK